MWLEELQSGKYKAVERYTDPVTGKQKKISIVVASDTRKSRKEAQAALDQKIDAILQRTNYDDMTLRQLCDRYIDSHAKASTKETCKVACKRICGLIGSDARVNALTAAYVSDKLSGLKPEGYNVCVTYFKTIMNFGFGHDYVKDTTWLRKIKKRKDNRRSRIEDKYLELEELRALLDGMPKQKWKLLTKFLALSCLRIGEAIALTVDDVDTYIHVNKTYMINVDQLGTVPKTADSNRDVFVQPELAEVVAEIRQWRLTELFRTGIRSNLLFPKVEYYSYCVYLERKSLESIGRKITPHALRHTHVSLLAASGMSLEAISRRLGHSNSSITKEVYFHMTEKLRQKEEAQLSQIKVL